MRWDFRELWLWKCRYLKYTGPNQFHNLGQQYGGCFARGREGEGGICRTSDIKLDAGEPGSPSEGCGLGSFAWQAFFFLNINTVVPVGQTSSRLLPLREGLPLLRSQKCFFTAVLHWTHLYGLVEPNPCFGFALPTMPMAHGPWPNLQTEPLLEL